MQAKTVISSKPDIQVTFSWDEAAMIHAEIANEVEDRCVFLNSLEMYLWTVLSQEDLRPERILD